MIQFPHVIEHGSDALLTLDRFQDTGIKAGHDKHPDHTQKVSLSRFISI
jgi:hypothetical protein